eukprot:scaffold61949_cov66-Attheya_sp.AAC.1
MSHCFWDHPCSQSSDSGTSRFLIMVEYLRVQSQSFANIWFPISGVDEAVLLQRRVISERLRYPAHIWVQVGRLFPGCRRWHGQCCPLVHVMLCNYNMGPWGPTRP